MNLYLMSLAAALQGLFTTTAQALGKATGFIRRRRRLTAAGFAQTLVFRWMAKPKTTLESLARELGVSPQARTAAWVRLPGPLAVGRQIGPGVARLGVGQGLLVPVRVARSWEAEHRSLPGRGPLDDLEPV